MVARPIFVMALTFMEKKKKKYYHIWRKQSKYSNYSTVVWWLSLDAAQLKCDWLTPPSTQTSCCSSTPTLNTKLYQQLDIFFFWEDSLYWECIFFHVQYRLSSLWSIYMSDATAESYKCFTWFRNFCFKHLRQLSFFKVQGHDMVTNGMNI